MRDDAFKHARVAVENLFWDICTVGDTEFKCRLTEKRYDKDGKYVKQILLIPVDRHINPGTEILITKENEEPVAYRVTDEYNKFITHKAVSVEPAVIYECHWCDSEYTIIDDDFGQPIHPRMIRYCFRCGKKLKEW